MPEQFSQSRRGRCPASKILNRAGRQGWKAARRRESRSVLVIPGFRS